jgi:cytochrome b pre-mRNA-processing protein 3
VSLLSRLFGRRGDDRAPVRPLWHRVIELSRDPAWYADLGVADTVPGRFDALTMVLSIVLIRMERDDSLRRQSAMLTELFVADMDGQLRQSGVGDLVVGKHVGRLMSVLGGRLGAYRSALATGDDAALAEAVARNVTLIEGATAQGTAERLRHLAARLDSASSADLLAGNFG